MTIHKWLLSITLASEFGTHHGHRGFVRRQCSLCLAIMHQDTQDKDQEGDGALVQRGPSTMSWHQRYFGGG